MRQWAKNYDRCVKCLSIDSMHTGRGLCARCRHKIFARSKRSGIIKKSENIINNKLLENIMEIRLGDIVGNVENIQELQKVKLPVKVSYKIMRLANKLDPILKSFNASKDALIKEYGEPKKDGVEVNGVPNYSVTDPKQLGLYVAKLGELLDTKEQVEFEPINVEDLGDVVLEAKLLVPFIFK